MIELTLRNYKRHRGPNQVRIQPGLTVISGENGAGKSTLTEALLHALFAERPGAEPQSDFSAEPFEVNLRMQGQNTHLDILVKGKQVQVDIDGNRLVNLKGGSQKEARKVVTHYLGGLGVKSFKQVYFALQGETHLLATAKNKDRKTLIEDVLQLGTVKLAVQKQRECVAQKKDAVLLQLTMAAMTAQKCTFETLLNERVVPFRTSTLDTSRLQAYGGFMLALKQTIDLQEEQAEKADQHLQERLELLQQVKAEVAKCVSGLDKLDAEIKALGDLKDQRTLAEKNLAAARGSMDACMSALQLLQQNLSQAEEAEPQARAHGQLMDQVKRLQELLAEHQKMRPLAQQRDQAQMALQKAAAELEAFSGLDHELEQRRASGRELQTSLQTFAENPHQVDVLRCEDRLAQLKKEHEEKTLALRQLTSNQGPVHCPTCGNELSAVQREQRVTALNSWLNVEHGKSKKALQQQKKHHEADFQKWQDQKKHLESQMARCQEAEVQLTRRQGERDEKNLQLLEKEAHLKILEAQCNEQNVPLPFPYQEQKRIESEIRQLQKEAQGFSEGAKQYSKVPDLRHQVEQAGGVLQAAETEVFTLEAVVQGIPFDLNALAELEAQKQTLQGTKDACMEKEKVQSLAVEKATNQLTTTQALLQQLRGCQTEAGTAHQQWVKEMRLLEHLCGFQDHFFDVNTRQAMRRASQLIKAATGQGIRTLALSTDGELTYWDHMLTEHPVSRLSGGEQALVGLSLRLALAEQAQMVSSEGRVRFLVLDEVLGSLDDERREQVQNIFNAVLESRSFDYILMISHIEEVKNHWKAHRLEVVKDPSTGVSEVRTLPSTFGVQGP